MSDNNNLDARLARLETIIDTVSHGLEAIRMKIESQAKINWAPITLGVSIIMAVIASFSTIYNTRITTLDDNVKILNSRQQITELASTESKIGLGTLDEKVKDQRITIDKQEQRISDLERRVN